MSEAYDTYYGMHVEEWLEQFEDHALEFANDVLSETPMWPLMKDAQGQPLTAASWAEEQRKIIEASEPIQSFLRLIETYVDEDEEEESEEEEETESADEAGP